MASETTATTQAPTHNSPFLDIPSFTPVESPAAEVAGEVAAMPSPFRAVYRTEDFEETTDPETEEVLGFLHELHDQDFEDAIFEIAAEMRELIGAQETGGAASAHTRQRMLDDYPAPITAEMERLLDNLADTADMRGTAFAEGEIDEVIDGYVVEETLSPAFEHLFGGWKKKLKKLAKKGRSLAKKGLKAAATLGLGPILRKLKGHVGKLLRSVLKRAIGKLPTYLQPVAQKLYKKYSGKLLKEMEFEEEDADQAVADPGDMQLEFDRYLTFYLYSDAEYEQDILLAEVEAEAEGWAPDPMAELQAARERFVEEISALEADEDPGPAVERFLPAILPILKTGIKIAGRKRIVNTLSGYLANLIRKLVGRRYAQPLSRAVVDLGLRYAGLEISDEESRNVGAEAVAFTVENTVRRLAELPEQVLENDEILKGEATAAFEAAAAAYLPDVLDQQTYEARPELHESCQPGFWVGMPLRGSRKVYRKLAGGTGEVNLCPHTLGRIRTWRGQTLASHLRNRLGAETGRRITARVHLFEVMPGGSLQDIARNDPDLQIAGRAPSWMLLHPLTREAAGMMLGEPALGRDFSGRYLDQPGRAPAVGQRFYFLRFPHGMPQVVIATGRPPALRRPSAVSLCLDMMQERISVAVFISETRAQGIAARLRGGARPVFVATALRPMIADGIAAALGEGVHNRVKVLHPLLPPEYSDGRVLGLLPAVVVRRLGRSLTEWVELGLAEKIGPEVRGFIEATEADVDGVTLRLTFSAPVGLRKMRAAIAGDPVRLREPWFTNGVPNATVHSFAGDVGA